MDEKILKAWKKIADRPVDTLLPPIVRMYRSDLKALVDEIYRLRELEQK